MKINETLERKGFKGTLFKFAAPAILSMWIFSLYTTIDGIFVGRGVGEQALAAVSLSMPFINITFALSVMTSIGASTAISTLMGKNDIQEARELFTLTVGFLAVAGFVVCSLGLFNMDKVAAILGAEGAMVPMVKEYLGTILIFNTFYLIAYAFEILIKVEGKPGVAMLVVAAAALTNVVLDYLLVIVIPMGLRGAAIATGSAQLIQGIILLSYFMRKDSRLKLTRVRPSLKRIGSLLKIGIPDSITELSTGFVILVFNRVILTYMGERGLVAFTIITYINSFIILTMIGLTQGMQPLVSFLEGMGDHAKKEKLFKLTIKASLVLGLFSYILVSLTGSHIVSAFVRDGETVIFAISALRRFAPAFLLVGLNIVISGYFTALEKTMSAGVLALLRGIVFIPIILAVMPGFIGSEVIWLATLISEILTLGVAYIFIRSEHGTPWYSQA